MLVGYARVSTIDQDTRMQRDAFKRAGVRRVFEEKASAVGGRPVLRQCVAGLRPGDVLVVWKLDRLARSLRDLLELLDLLDQRGCSFRSLTEPIDTSSPLGELVVQILGAVAQFERRLIRERVVAGQVSAMAQGVRFGRPYSLDESQRAQVVKLHLRGVRKVDIARKFGVAPNVIYRAVAQGLDPDHPRYGHKRPVLGPLVKLLK